LSGSMAPPQGGVVAEAYVEEAWLGHLAPGQGVQRA
jgi:hypothetical protein